MAILQVSPKQAIDSAVTVPIKNFDPRTAWPEGGIKELTALTFLETSFSSPSGFFRYAQSSFRVDSSACTSCQRKVVSGVFSEESGNGPGRREWRVCGRNIKAISEPKILPFKNCSFLIL